MSAAGDETDAAFAAAAIAGDQQAFSKLMQRHKNALYQFVRRYVGDADEAFDLVQESFVAAWTALDSFDRRRPFSAWLRRIALNKCRDWSRRRRVRQFFFGAVSLDRDVASPSPDPERSASAALAKLDEAIARLPTALKEPLLLVVHGGLSHQDAGKALGISAKSVETRIYRAKQTLRRVLDEGGSSTPSS